MDWAMKEKSYSQRRAWQVLRMPECAPLIAPIVHTIPAQLLAYHAALAKGTDATPRLFSTLTRKTPQCPPVMNSDRSAMACSLPLYSIYGGGQDGSSGVDASLTALAPDRSPLRAVRCS